MSRDMPLGCVIVDIGGTSLEAEDREILLHPLVGGIILFARNFESAEQLAELNREIHALRTPSLAITVDQEGGRVQRFQSGFTVLPAASHLGRNYRQVSDKNREEAYKDCQLCGWLMASEMKAVGMDVSYAPVVDLDWGVSTVIGDRSFHRDPHAICDLASRYIAGMHQAGMKSVIKHFPGHGYVVADSHTSLPVDSRSYDEISREDMVPFEHLGQLYGEGLMTAHIVFSQVDKAPVTFSHKWLQHVLRDRINFEGVIFSDDLSMQAAREYGDIATRARLAFQAGCDIVLVCNNRAETLELLEQLGDYHNPIASARLTRMRGTAATLSLSELRNTQQWQQAHDRVIRYVETQVLEPEFDL